MKLVERHFTEEGTTLQDVLESIEYNKRDAVIVNQDGEEVFRQSEVEFPVFWSDAAVRVVSSKYFSGVLESEGREDSVKQLITRVVKKISSWGADGGYFSPTDESDSEDEDDLIDIFESEMAYSLLHQYL